MHACEKKPSGAEKPGWAVSGQEKKKKKKSGKEGEDVDQI